MSICLNCNTGESTIHKTYGILSCQDCLDRQATFKKPHETIEVTTSEIRRQRKEYAKDIVQPFRGGTFSKEYYDAHGTKGVNVTKQELKNMKNVWKETHFYE